MSVIVFKFTQAALNKIKVPTKEERRKINKERRDKREKKLELQNELTFKQLHKKYINE